MVATSAKSLPPRIFISHADEDNDFAKALIVLFKAIGVNVKNCVLCTSESGLGVKVGRDWVDELKKSFTDYQVYVVIIHSSHLYKSPVSMNEMGAAWVTGCRVFSFLVNGFMESSMAGVFTSNHQGVLVGRKNIAPDIDQLKDDIIALFGLPGITEQDWTVARDIFIKTIVSLPADRGIVQSQFDVNQVEHIHLEGPFGGEDSKKEEKDIKWVDILKAVDLTLRSPHTESAIKEALINAYPNIIGEDVKTIIDKLRHYGLAETQVVNTEYDGISVAWTFTEKGRDAYERSMNFHLQPIYQERDKAQIIELMSYFSTNAMDEYLKEGPDLVSDIVLISRDTWNSIISGSAFQIFNPSLLAVLKPFYELLFQMTGHGECYEIADGRKYRLYQPEFGPVNKRDEATINWLYENMPKLTKRYLAFINYLKANYPDIDLKDFSTRFEQNCRNQI